MVGKVVKQDRDLRFDTNTSAFLVILRHLNNKQTIYSPNRTYNINITCLASITQNLEGQATLSILLKKKGEL